MVNCRIRCFEKQDLFPVIELWNGAVPADGITQDIFERKVLLDANFDPEGLILSEVDGKLAGFMLCIVRQVPMEVIGMQEELGWITMTGVLPEYRHKGVGTQMWKKAEAFFLQRKRKLISIATYSPNYFIPGIDIKEYPSAISFFEKKGFNQGAKPLSMDNPIVTYKIPEELQIKERKLREEGIEIRPYKREMITELLDFMKKYMPGDWLKGIRDNLALLTIGKFKEEQIMLAMKGNEILGYAQYEEEHFGPFGVRDDYQGKGIGQVLLARTIQMMHNRGHHNAWFLWTDDKAAHVYQKVGFKETRRFVVMKKELKYS
jgi:GNAT superfamily N-acetyltransferase